MKSKKTILFDEDESSLFDFMLIGISCHLKDYRLAWGLNSVLNIRLEKNETPIELKDGQHLSKHTVFSCSDEFGTEVSLIKNRSSIYLAKELSHSDYFLKIEGEVENEESLIAKLKEAKGVLAVFQLNVEELKSKENFIF